MELNAEERAVLAHMVADVSAWAANAVQALGEVAATAAMGAKVARHRDAYLVARAAEGAAYKTRAVRQAEEDEAAQRGVEAAAAASAEAEAEKQRAFDAAVRAAVAAAFEAKA